MTPTERLKLANDIADRLQYACERMGDTLGRERALRMAEELVAEGWRKVEPPTG